MEIDWQGMQFYTSKITLVYFMEIAAETELIRILNIGSELISSKALIGEWFMII